MCLGWRKILMRKPFTGALIAIICSFYSHFRFEMYYSALSIKFSPIRPVFMLIAQKFYCIFAGVINRGDSFRRKRSRSNSLATSPMSPNHSPSHPTPSRSSTGPVETHRVSMLGGPGVGKTALISQFRTSECINAYEDTGERSNGHRHFKSFSWNRNRRTAEHRTPSIRMPNEIPNFVLFSERKSSAWLMRFDYVSLSVRWIRKRDPVSVA